MPTTKNGYGLRLKACFRRQTKFTYPQGILFTVRAVATLATAQKQHSCFVKQNQAHCTETDYATLQVGEYFYKEMMKIKR
jgi:hypothetical protein